MVRKNISFCYECCVVNAFDITFKAHVHTPSFSFVQWCYSYSLNYLIQYINSTVIFHCYILSFSRQHQDTSQEKSSSFQSQSVGSYASKPPPLTINIQQPPATPITPAPTTPALLPPPPTPSIPQTPTVPPTPTVPSIPGMQPLSSIFPEKDKEDTKAKTYVPCSFSQYSNYSVTDCRNLVKTVVCGVKTITWGVSSCKITNGEFRIQSLLVKKQL